VDDRGQAWWVRSDTVAAAVWRPGWADSKGSTIATAGPAGVVNKSRHNPASTPYVPEEAIPHQKIDNRTMIEP
jgi:hypothetical protein